MQHKNSNIQDISQQNTLSFYFIIEAYEIKMCFCLFAFFVFFNQLKSSQLIHLTDPTEIKKDDREKDNRKI